MHFIVKLHSANFLLNEYCIVLYKQYLVLQILYAQVANNGNNSLTWHAVGQLPGQSQEMHFLD